MSQNELQSDRGRSKRKKEGRSEYDGEDERRAEPQ